MSTPGAVLQERSWAREAVKKRGLYNTYMTISQRRLNKESRRQVIQYMADDEDLIPASLRDGNAEKHFMDAAK